MFKSCFIATVAVSLVALPMLARADGSPPLLSLPVACELGKTCFVQNYPDVAVGAEARDYSCGALTYNGHQGVDFRLASLSDMRAGVDVLAAAAGTVAAVHDGETDRLLPENYAGPGTDCGNSVQIAHGEGWATLYCHLKNGSIGVQPGDEVQPGTPIAQIGGSGDTSFPHLHMALQRGLVAVDPFTGREVSPAHSGCVGDGAGNLWNAAGLKSYNLGEVMNFGIAGEPPSFAQIFDDPTLLVPPGGGNLHFWVHFVGVREGDRVRMAFWNPHGLKIADEIFEVRTSDPVFFTSIGIGPEDGNWNAWPSGAYRGAVALSRAGKIITAREASVERNPDVVLQPQSSWESSTTVIR